MPKIILTKIITVFILMVSFCISIHAKKIDSYIINNSNDTIYGTIEISKFNLSQNTVSISSYNTDDLFYHIFFKSVDTHQTKELFPDDILEFGFLLEMSKYKYISRESKVKLGNNKRLFYLQLEYGPINLYVQKIILNNQDMHTNPNGNSIVEFYISADDKNLIKVAKSDANETIVDFLLKNLKLDKAILENVTSDKTFKDIRTIVVTYNEHFEKVDHP